MSQGFFLDIDKDGWPEAAVYDDPYHGWVAGVLCRPDTGYKWYIGPNVGCTFPWWVGVLVVLHFVLVALVIKKG